MSLAKGLSVCLRVTVHFFLDLVMRPMLHTALASA